MDIFNTTSPFSPESDASHHHHHHHHHHHLSRPPSPHTAPTEAVEKSTNSEPSRAQSPESSTNDSTDDESPSPSPPPDSPTDDSTQADSNGNSRITWNSVSGHHPKHYDPSDSDQASKPRRKLLHMRGYDDQDETDWWFASTACPLLAATIAPLANVLSIAALVTFWRMDVQDYSQPPPAIVPDFEGVPYRDPRWCYWVNVTSLICGFAGNIFLLFNFTGRIRYIVALPATILLWYMATFLLLADTVSMHLWEPPIGPYHIYSQGFWYAVISIILYSICSTILLFNMTGYFLGHYPQRFELNDHQRTLILQTMLFFVWLAAGAAVFSRVENNNDGGNANWAFVDGLYFCDVTILTLGFGDLVPHNNLGRGLVFPYSVGGIIMLGLVISSISRFATEMGEENVVRKHVERIRTRTLERTTSDPLEIERLQILQNFRGAHLTHLTPISAPFHGRKYRQNNSASSQVQQSSASMRSSQRRASVIPAVHKRLNVREAIKLRQKKIKLLRNERDRFNEMRRIQKSTASFKRWWALTVSVMAFSILWLVGAVVFWQTEKPGQQWTYFDGLYFCYVALITIGYGDFTPTSNAGRSFFVVWSLIAVPTMTLLISDMSSTVIESFNRGTFIAADFTLLLKKNLVTDFINAHPRIKGWLVRRRLDKERRKREKEGLPVGNAANDDFDIESNAGRDEKAREEGLRPSVEEVAREITRDADHPPNLTKITRRLAVAIRTVAADLKMGIEREYSFEEWAELTRLIRFTGERMDVATVEEEEDVIEWDWLGEDSPMMTHDSEPEFVLEKLCESLVRYTRRVEKKITWVKRELAREEAPRKDSADNEQPMTKMKEEKAVVEADDDDDDDESTHEEQADDEQDMDETSKTDD